MTSTSVRVGAVLENGDLLWSRRRRSGVFGLGQALAPETQTSPGPADTAGVTNHGEVERQVLELLDTVVIGMTR